MPLLAILILKYVFPLSVSNGYYRYSTFLFANFPLNSFLIWKPSLSAKSEKLKFRNIFYVLKIEKKEKIVVRHKNWDHDKLIMLQRRRIDGTFNLHNQIFLSFCVDENRPRVTKGSSEIGLFSASNTQYTTG